MRAPRYSFPTVLVLLATIGASALSGGCSNDSRPGPDARPIDIEEQSLLQGRIQEGITKPGPTEPPR